MVVEITFYLLHFSLFILFISCCKGNTEDDNKENVEETKKEQILMKRNEQENQQSNQQPKMVKVRELVEESQMSKSMFPESNPRVEAAEWSDAVDDPFDCNQLPLPSLQDSIGITR